MIGYKVVKQRVLPTGRVEVTVVDDTGYLFKVSVHRRDSTPEGIENAVRAYQATLGHGRGK